MLDRGFDPVTHGYLSYLKDIKRLTERTIVDVSCTFGKLRGIAEEWRPEVLIWKLEFNDFLKWVGKLQEAGTSDKSVIKQICHIRGLLNYAWRNEKIDRNVLDGFHYKDRTKRTAPNVLTLGEAERVVNACSNKTTLDRKKRLLVLLLYGCGLRTGELKELNIKDIDIERQEIFIAKGKGDVQRRIPVPSGVWVELLAYLNEIKRRGGILFKTDVKKKRITDGYILEVIREVKQKAGIKKELTPRTLRHTFASHLMDSGVRIEVISSLMGHKSARETGVYLHAFKEGKENAIAKINLDEKEDDE